MNLSAEQKQTPSHRDQTWGCQGGTGGGVGWTGSLGSVGANPDPENGEAMRSCCAAQGTLCSVLG